MVFDRAEAGAERRFDDTERVGNFSILIRLACETNRGRQARRSAGALARARAVGAPKEHSRAAKARSRISLRVESKRPLRPCELRDCSLRLSEKRAPDR